MKSTELQNILELMEDEEDKVFVSYFMGQITPLDRLMVIYFFYKNPDELKRYMKGNQRRSMKRKRRQLFSGNFFRLFTEYLFEEASIYDHKLLTGSNGGYEIVLGYKTQYAVSNTYPKIYEEEWARLNIINESILGTTKYQISKIYHQFCL